MLAFPAILTSVDRAFQCLEEYFDYYGNSWFYYGSVMMLCLLCIYVHCAAKVYLELLKLSVNIELCTLKMSQVCPVQQWYLKQGLVWNTRWGRVNPLVQKKRHSDLVDLCHPLDLSFELDSVSIHLKKGRNYALSSSKHNLDTYRSASFPDVGLYLLVKN